MPTFKCRRAQESPTDSYEPWNLDAAIKLHGHPVLLPLPPGGARGGKLADKVLTDVRNPPLRSHQHGYLRLFCLLLLAVCDSKSALGFLHTAGLLQRGA